MIKGDKISNIEFFPKKENGKIEWFANIYYNNSKPPIQVSKEESTKYLEAAAVAQGIAKDDSTLVSKLVENGTFTKCTEKEANAHFQEEMEKNKSGILHKLNKKAVKGALAIGLAIAVIAGGCNLIKKSKNKEEENINRISNSEHYNNAFDELLTKLQAGPKKDAVSATQKALKNFNDNLSGSIMREGEDKRLAHSWDENIAAYLAFNQFTDEELFQIFDTYKIDGNELYDQLKLGNMKEMLYYARATQPSGKADLIKSEEGKAFFNKYESLVLKFNTVESKEEKVTIAKQFYEMARADFPIKVEDKEGFIHTEKGYEDYSYAVTPMIAAMEVMTRNVGVSLTNQEVQFFNELGMCNFADEKLTGYQSQLEARQNIEIAKEELRVEYETNTSSNGQVVVTETISYEQLKEAGIASIEHYDLSAEKNDVGTIPGYWEDATLDTAKKQQIQNSAKNGSTTTKKTESYHKTITEEELKTQPASVQQQAQKQKEEIEKSFEEKNTAAKKESDKKKEEVEKEIQKEKEKLEKEVEKDNSWMDYKESTTSSSNSNSSNTSSSTEAPARPSRDDVDDHIKIDDEYIDENGNLEFDGPIYDKNGNIIDNPSAKANARKIEEVINNLADPNADINQNTNSGIVR